MDSRIREALEDAVGFVVELKKHGIYKWSGEDKLREALSLLTAEPAPCESALARVNQLEETRGMSCLTPDQKVSIINTYATRREQESRDDERLKDSTIVDEFLKLYYPEQRKRFGITLCAAILQGTEPAKHYDSEDKQGTYDNPVDADPAKVSEDVERDIETVRDAIMAGQYRIDDGDDTHEALTATEPATVELPKCDHCGAIACGTDCDGSSHYTPEKKE